MTDFVCLDDFEIYARKHKLNADDADFIIGGSMREVTLRDNVEAFKRYRLIPRVLRDVSAVDLSSSILGHNVSMPLGIAPMGLHKIAHPEGENGTAKAAGSANVAFTLGSYASCSVEEAVHNTGVSLKLYQLYVMRNDTRKIALLMIEQAVRQGFSAIAVTVDHTVHGVRYRNIRNRYKAPSHIKSEILSKYAPSPDYNSIYTCEFDPAMTWDFVRWLVSVSPIPVALKGILSPEDARLAVECGVAAVWVSNHGGRQLDAVPATLTVLEPIVEAVAGRCEVYVDGGIRCGTDVFIALALGAKAVFIGRPAMYGLACAGEAGVTQVLNIIRNEFRVVMMLMGCPKLQDIKRSMVTPTSVSKL